MSKQHLFEYQSLCHPLGKRSYHIFLGGYSFHEWCKLRQRILLLLDSFPGTTHTILEVGYIYVVASKKKKEVPTSKNESNYASELTTL